MGDLNRIQNSQTVQITDDGSQLAALSSSLAGTEVGLVTRPIFETNSGTLTIAGTVTLSSQTVTLSSQTVTLSSQTVTLSSQTVTLSSQTVNTNADAAIAAGTAPAKALVAGAVYNYPPTPVATGQSIALQTDGDGNLFVSNVNDTEIKGLLYLILSELRKIRLGISIMNDVDLPDPDK